MTIKELYQYAADNKLEDLPLEVIGIAECGYSAVMDTSFYIRKDERDNRKDRIQLIVTEDGYDLSSSYDGAVLSDDIKEP